jgi:Protein of unknown function (DUF1559)
MSDDLERDDRRQESIRPRRTDPIRAGRPDGGRPRRADDDPYDDVPSDSGGGSGVKIVLIILVVIGIIGLLVVVACGGGGYFLFRGASRSITQAANRVQTMNNYKQVALGMHNYHSAKGSFPPVALKTKDGKPGLSWRVAILPYVEQESLYRRFKLDEPWDSPNNKPLGEQMPRIYAPADAATVGNQTHMRLFVGKGAIFDLTKSSRLTDITDGTANTIMIVESTGTVTWTKPEELDFDPKGTLPALGMPQNDFFLVTMADASVRPIKKTISPEKIKAAITATGNETVFLDE